MAALRGQQGVAGFYRAFYSWSQLNTVNHGRRYSSQVASAAATPASDISGRFVRRLPWFTYSEKVHALAANNDALLNQIQEQTGVRIIYSGVPRPGSKKYRIYLTGEGDAIQECKNLILSLNSESGVEAATGAATSPTAEETARPLNISYTSRTREDAGPGLEVLQSQFKNIMRHTASNVAILTTDLLSGKNPDTPEAPPKHWNLRAMTISSLTPVTLSPEPIISFNIKAPSRTLDAILASKLLVATFLTPTPQGAKIAHAFTQPSEDPSTPFRQLESLGLLEIHGNPRSGPKFVGDAISARLRCVVSNFIKVADHVVVFARVSHVWTKGLEPVSETFLAYSRGGYRVLGQESLDAMVPETKIEDVDGWLEEVQAGEDEVGSGKEEVDFTEAYYRSAEDSGGVGREGS